MIGQVSKSLLRHCTTRTKPTLFNAQKACFGTSEKSGSIMDAWQKSCYHEMNYTISEEATVFEAVEKFAGYDVGALIALDSEGKTLSILERELGWGIEWLYITMGTYGFFSG